jgi:hypothetical protein
MCQVSFFVFQVESGASTVDGIFEKGLIIKKGPTYKAEGDFRHIIIASWRAILVLSS